MKSTRQVSRSKIGGNHEEFSLGRFYPPRRPITFNKELSYLSTEFFDGSHCELMGIPRRSRIRYICADDKQNMYVSNVMETSACSYDYIVHVPELCAHIPKHGMIEQKISRIICPNYSIPKSFVDTEKIVSKSKDKFNNLDQMLNFIESTYKSSNLLSQYKAVLNKATEKLKSQQLDKDFENYKSSDDSLLELLTKIIKPEDTQFENIEEPNNDTSKEEK